jgi:hypothetical protein
MFCNYSEPNVQHEETPQPPPENPREGMEELPSSPEPEEQQNEDITFFTSLDVHFGHFVSCSAAFMPWSNENFSLHFRHIYSYIGIPDSFKVSIVINFISQYTVKSINAVFWFTFTVINNEPCPAVKLKTPHGKKHR